MGDIGREEVLVGWGWSCGGLSSFIYITRCLCGTVMFGAEIWSSSWSLKGVFNIYDFEVLVGSLTVLGLCDALKCFGRSTVASATELPACMTVKSLHA